MSVAGPVRLATILGGLALATVLALTARSMRPRPPPLPVVGHVPTFRLVDERGAPFTTGSMLGHVSVVDFIFTRCTSSCPRLTARMAELQRRLVGEPDVRLVSFSVDPENDTPAVLADYAAKAGAQAGRWTFVTGAVDDIERAVVLGFKVSAAKIAKGATDYDVVHGEWLVLVDRAGDLRGYYPVGEERELQALVDDASRVARESHPGGAHHE